MSVNKDKPWTWIKYKNDICNNCIGTCCTMPLEVLATDLIRLGLTGPEEVDESPKKLAKRLIKEKVLASYREKTGLFMLQQKQNGDCYFLDSKTRLCTQYDNRPQVCRNFPESIGPRLGYCPKIPK